MKICLAGFTDQQVATYAAMFPSVDFTLIDGAAAMDASADALIGITRGAFDEVFTPDVIGRCPSLKWVHAPGAGIDTYLYPNLADAPFALTNGKIIQGPEVAEQAVALLLALTRRVVYALKGVVREEIPRPVELRGKRALVIGLGGIGLGLAERLAAFGMTVDAVSEENVPLISFVNKIYLADQLPEALPGADAVLMAAPLTPASRQMIGREAFASMKEGVYFVNVSRGGTVDTDALLDAIERGHIGGAGLDVTDPEPLPADHPLRSCDNVVLTPHLAGISDNLRQRNFDLISTNIRRFIGGLTLINTVNKTLGY